MESARRGNEFYNVKFLPASTGFATIIRPYPEDLTQPGEVPPVPPGNYLSPDATVSIPASALGLVAGTPVVLGGADSALGAAAVQPQH